MCIKHVSLSMTQTPDGGLTDLYVWKAHNAVRKLHILASSTPRKLHFAFCAVAYSRARLINTIQAQSVYDTASGYAFNDDSWSF